MQKIRWRISLSKSFLLVLLAAMPSPAQTFTTTLYSFCSEADCADGDQPLSGLVQGSDGDFYGTTYGGGTYNYGTIYRITPSGALTILHSFNDTDGAYPWGGLVRGTNGSFYGTTSEGGSQRQRDRFQNHDGWRTDDDLHLLPAGSMPRRR